MPFYEFNSSPYPEIDNMPLMNFLPCFEHHQYEADWYIYKIPSDNVYAIYRNMTYVGLINRVGNLCWTNEISDTRMIPTEVRDFIVELLHSSGRDYIEEEENNMYRYKLDGPYPEYRFNNWVIFGVASSGIRCGIFEEGREIAYVDSMGMLEYVNKKRIPIRVLQAAGAQPMYVEQMRSMRPTKRISEFSPDDVFFDRTFGIEIEAFHPSDPDIKEKIQDELLKNDIECSIEYYNHRNSTTHWKITTDSSIHGEYTFELVSPILKGEEAFRQIEIVCNVLKDLNVDVNRSCGLHVHHQANDLARAKILKCFKYYKNNELILDSLMPNSRREDHNRFCQSLIGLNTRTWKRDRYYKINYCSYSRHSTIEFRHHSGTIEFDKIKYWVILTQRLLLRATNKECSSLCELLSDVGITNHEWYVNRRNYVAEHLIA